MKSKGRTQDMKQQKFCNIALLVVLWCCTSFVGAAENSKHWFNSTNNLLNAYRSPLSALASPGNFYFLEFPVGSGLSPMCGDGTPFSFAFRRGDGLHVSKLLIELEGGPACWGQDISGNGACCSSDAALQTPWYSFYSQQENKQSSLEVFPQLNSCTGVTPGFAHVGAHELFGRNNSHTEDLPLALRNQVVSDINDAHWWNVLGGNHSSITSWSYILIPHCTLDWHLGHQVAAQTILCDGTASKNEKASRNATFTNKTSTKAVYHRGGTNVDAVVEWIQAQFPNGLDALVVLSGGRLGGCKEFADASTVASSIVASKLADRSPSLVISEGSALWKPNLPTPDDLADRWNAIDIPHGSTLAEGLGDWIQSSPESYQVAWLASPGGIAGKQEQSFLRDLEVSKGESMHILQAAPSEQKSRCPMYAFPEESSTKSLIPFLQHIIERLSWDKALRKAAMDQVASSNSSSHLSFLSISLIVLGLVVLIWITYFAINHCRSRGGSLTTMTPTDLWFVALTRYPLTFLILSVVIPVSLSCAAYVNSSRVTVNLDFDSYLVINTPLENVRRAYDRARAHQRETLTIEAEDCEILSVNSSLPSVEGRRDLLDDRSFKVVVGRDLSLDDVPLHYRELYSSNMLYASGGEVISIMYQNRNGGNVFEPEVLRDIFRFEQDIYNFPGFANYCFGFGPGRCIPIDSLVTHFFPGGNLVSNIDGVVKSFLGNQPALWKLDQNFGPDNLQSEVIRSFVFLNNVGGDQRAAHPFLKSLYRDYFWKTDQRDVYPAMIHTWDNEYLKEVEADDALRHDILWSIGSLCFILLLILFKVRSLFVTFFSMLGLILAFSAAYYWASIHFGIESATLLWVAGLYVMLGIGTDDIFLMVDTFEHTNIELGHGKGHRQNEGEDVEGAREAQLDLLRERMKEAYRKAGSMMLVSSVTTAIGFFSNAFGILVVIQEFGIFMGLVVLVNFLHVMTILPSAILVNEFYVLPLQRKFSAWCDANFAIKPSLKTHKEADLVRHDSETIAVRSPNDCATFLEDTSHMNQMDRWLVSKFAPFITKRALCALLFTLALSMILGALGITMFAMSDGNIVLFTEKYNLGRLAVVTDKYFNKDIKKTVEEKPEKSKERPTTAPTENLLAEDSTPSPGAQKPTSGATLPESAGQGGNNNNGGVWADATGGHHAGATFEGSTSNTTDFESTSDSNLSSSDSMNDGGSEPSQSSGTTTAPAPTPLSGSAGSSAIGGSGTDTDTGSTPSNGSEGGGPIPIPASAPIPQPVHDQSVTAAPIAVAPLGPNSGLDLRRRETIFVNLIWGVEPAEIGQNLWTVRQNVNLATSRFGKTTVPSSSFDPSDPKNQEALLRAVRMARSDESLEVQPDKTTWIEMLYEFAVDSEIGFPLPRDLFVGYVKLLKERNARFSDLVSREIGTQSPGLAGDFTFVSITLEVNAVQSESLSLSESVYRQWTAFAAKVNEGSSAEVPDMVAQSRIFLDAYRAEATIESTVTSWFISNGLILLVILLFTRNIALSLMVMGTTILIFFCLGGIIFSMLKIPFGAVEALGISIFLGLSANYSLHVVHAYLHAKGNNRIAKVTEAIFAVGGSIVASATSTIGASVFLFGCRTWVFVELGLLVSSITALALLYSMTFLLAWLVTSGPRPFERGGQHFHAWDIRALCFCKVPATQGCENDWNEINPKTPTTSGTICIDLVSLSNESFRESQGHDDDNSDYSIEVVHDDHRFVMMDVEDENGRNSIIIVDD